MKKSMGGRLILAMFALAWAAMPLQAADRCKNRTKEVMIIAGSTAAGAAVGGVLGGGRGAVAGAVAGGAGATIYERAKDHRGERANSEKITIIGGSAGAGAVAGGVAAGKKGAMIGGAIGAAGGYILHKKTEGRRRWIR